MGRPRTPAKILELKGAFKKNPQRRRSEAEGAAPFDRDPPGHLTGAEQAAWRKLMERLPVAALYNTDEIGIAQMARIMAALEPLHPSSPDFVRLDNAFRAWAVQFGYTLQARTKIPGPEKPGDGGNPFASV